MLIAAATEGERKVLILGLQQENIDKLLNDQPIRKDLKEERVPGLEDWDLYVLGPEDTVRFVTRFRP